MGYIYLTAAMGCIACIALYCLGAWTVTHAARLAHVNPPARDDWPAISVVFAARDEALSIGHSIDTLLSLDYPALEVIAVNDRSSDATGRIIDEAARRDPRLRAVHIHTLPEGWLGKVHALERGFQESSDGQWLLFTDADVKFAPDTLKKAVTMAEARDVQHLVLFPKLIEASFWLEVAFVAFSVLFMAGTKAFRVGRPGSRAFIGVGAFNMVKRETLKRSKGFEWLRMEVADDVGLGMLMRDAGARAAFAFAEMGVHLAWYRTLAQMFRGMQKNLFMAAYYSYSRLVPMLVLLTVMGLSPLMGLVPGAPPALKALSVASLLSTAALGLSSRRLFISRTVPYLLGPLGFLLITMMMVNSALICAIKGGIEWRGTLYPLKALRKGQRVKL